MKRQFNMAAATTGVEVLLVILVLRKTDKSTGR